MAVEVAHQHGNEDGQQDEAAAHHVDHQAGVAQNVVVVLDNVHVLVVRLSWIGGRWSAEARASRLQQPGQAGGDRQRVDDHAHGHVGGQDTCPEAGRATVAAQQNEVREEAANKLCKCFDCYELVFVFSQTTTTTQNAYLQSKQATGDQADPRVQRVEVHGLLFGRGRVVLGLDGEQHTEADHRDGQQEEDCVEDFVVDSLAANICFIDEDSFTKIIIINLFNYLEKHNLHCPLTNTKPPSMRRA